MKTLRDVIGAWLPDTRPKEPLPLTRKEFYNLAKECREYAFELAQYDQTRVNLKQCHKFNEWFLLVKQYDLLYPALHSLKMARPFARWQLMTLGFVIGLILLFSMSPKLEQLVRTSAFYGYLFFLIFLYFIPERIYGTTIELVEGKVLRVVEEMERLLISGELDFTEAAYFQVKENLAAARTELRQQIDLVYRQ